MDAEDVDQALLRFTLEQSAKAAHLGLLGALVVGAVAAPAVGPWGAGAWTGGSLAVLVGRNALLKRAVRRLPEPGGTLAAQRVLGVSSVVLALVLAALPVTAFPAIHLDLRFVLTLFFCCWCAAAMSSLGMRPFIFSLYLALLLGGTVLGWFRAQDPQALAIGAGLLLYWAVLLVFSRSFAQRIREGIAIRNENAQLVQQLSAANAAKSRFIMSASHDLRQPLHAIGLLGGLLTRATNPADLDNARSALMSALQGLNTLFTAIMDLSNLDSGTLRPNPRTVALHELVGRLDAEYRVLCIETGRRWECRSEQASVRTDPVLLERLLRNLLDNALKHGGQGAVRLELTGQGGTVALRVADTGPGIALHDRARVFDEFYRGAGAGETRGIGLGLAIVRRLAELLECRLQVTFTDPLAMTGACFTLELPMAGADAAAAHGGDGKSGEAPPDVAGLSILVVDDDATVLGATRAVLAQWGCEVRTCRSSAELAAIGDSGWRPDVALADFKFEPGLSGPQALAPLCAAHPAMGLVVVTGETDASVLAPLAELGLPVLGKPTDPQELRLTLSLFKSMT